MPLGRRFIVSFSVAIAALFGDTIGAEAVCPAANAQQVTLRCAQWLAAYRARDLQRVMSIFDRHVTFQFQGSPDASWTALRRSYQQEFATAAKTYWSPAFERVEASGNLAVAFSKWSLLEPGRNGHQIVKVTNNSVDVFGRDNACQWKIVRSMTYRLK